ncbi:sigma-70 family RNA polymerase sigma factor [Kribbella sp. NPDC051587]|uniref:sigma-70 family RNA polymerase sigma factor n=1 Tax=Kribbella sp. NPDC051587 TaxID=3364119 RepID=UPI00378F905B
MSTAAHRTAVIEHCLAEQESLRRYVASLIGQDSHTVEDVVQETLLRAWQSADRIDYWRRPVRMWMFRVARNLVIDHRRRHSRVAPTGLTVVDWDRPTLEPDHADQIADRRLVIKLLRGLSPAHREVMALLHLQGLVGPEVATALGVPVGTVKSRAHHALRQLRAC